MVEIELTNSIKQRFISDFKLPINVYSDPYFDYYMELYNPIYNTYEKMEWLNKVLEKCSNQEDFFGIPYKLADDIKNLILQTTSYKQFNEADMNKMFPLEENIKQQNIYIDPNVGKKLISIDLKQANYNSFKMFGLQEEINAPTYMDLMKKFTDETYFLESKKIRQVIFGDLNASRQQRIQKYIINVFCKKLKEQGCILSSASSDEIIISNPDMTVEQVQSFLNDVPEKLKFFRVEQFQFDRIEPGHDYFVKKTMEANGQEKLEFKNVPSQFFAQVYKKHFNLALDDKDMLFYHDKRLAEFKEPIFIDTPIIKNKVKMK